MITKNTSFSLRGILLDFNCEATLLLELLQLHARIFETKLARLWRAFKRLKAGFDLPRAKLLSAIFLTSDHLLLNQRIVGPAPLLWHGRAITCMRSHDRPLRILWPAIRISNWAPLLLLCVRVHLRVACHDIRTHWLLLEVVGRVPPFVVNCNDFFVFYDDRPAAKWRRPNCLDAAVLWARIRLPTIMGRKHWVVSSTRNRRSRHCLKPATYFQLELPLVRRRGGLRVYVHGTRNIFVKADCGREESVHVSRTERKALSCFRLLYGFLLELRFHIDQIAISLTFPSF